MLFNYSDANHTITTELNIIPSKDSSIVDISNEYIIFRKMYKNFLFNFHNIINIEEEVYKKTFIEIIKRIKSSNGITLSLNECEEIITDVFYCNTSYENIIFDYEDTLYVELVKYIEMFKSVYDKFIFIDYIIYKSCKIKVLATEGV